MEIKKHLEGGTLRKVMVDEIRRCLEKYSGQGQVDTRAALELGVTPKTLRVWRGPVDKGGWKELQLSGGMEKLIKAGGLKYRKKKAIHIVKSE